MNKDDRVLVLALNGEKVSEVRILRNGGSDNSAPVSRYPEVEIRNLCEKYPGAYIAWFDKKIEPFLSDISTWPGLIKHDLEVLHLSCFQRCDLAAGSIGFVDFGSPCLIPGPTDRRYATWLISSMAGIGLARTFTAFGFDPSMKSLSAALFDFGRRGLMAGLCPYSDPGLLAKKIPPEISQRIRRLVTNKEAAVLIARNRGKKWLLFWVICWILFKRRLPLIGLINGVRAKKPVSADNKAIRTLHPPLADISPGKIRLEVVIPTLDRTREVLDLLGDLSSQTLLPAKVIIIEQKPGEGESELENRLPKAKWPFEIAYYRIRQIGVCRARNLALKEAKGDWILMLDDDVRLRPNLIMYLLQAGKAYNVDMVNGRVYLEGQQASRESGGQLPFIWQAFGSGSALLSRKAVETTGNFDESLEGGFGEDYEFGIRARLAGNNVLYAPAEPVLHLKFPRGGFRSEIRHPWDSEKIIPRPSPTVLRSRSKYGTRYMQDGYKFFYWSKRLVSVPFYSWPREIFILSKEWRSAVRWAERLSRSPTK